MLTIGSVGPDHKHVELFHFKTTSWFSIGVYPYADAYFMRAPIIYQENAFYVLGGSNANSASNTIGRLDAINFSWSLAGHLNAARRGHNAILIDDVNVIVVGGYETTQKSFKNEKCTISQSGTMTCMDQSPTLSYFVDWPELFLVSEQFC